MNLTLAAISPREAKSPGDLASFADAYLARASRLAHTTAAAFRTEAALLDSLTRAQTRTPAHLCLFDSTGTALSSTAFAASIGRLRDAGTQRIVFAIGPASGWSSAALTRADRILSLGPMTLPHELARVIAAEQIYRALTILAGHPYHLGH